MAEAEDPAAAEIALVACAKPAKEDKPVSKWHQLFNEGKKWKVIDAHAGADDLEFVEALVELGVEVCKKVQRMRILRRTLVAEECELREARIEKRKASYLKNLEIEHGVAAAREIFATHLKDPRSEYSRDLERKKAVWAREFDARLAAEGLEAGGEELEGGEKLSEAEEFVRDQFQLYTCFFACNPYKKNAAEWYRLMLKKEGRLHLWLTNDLLREHLRFKWFRYEKEVFAELEQLCEQEILADAAPAAGAGSGAGAGHFAKAGKDDAAAQAALGNEAGAPTRTALGAAKVSKKSGKAKRAEKTDEELEFERVKSFALQRKLRFFQAPVWERYASFLLAMIECDLQGASEVLKPLSEALDFKETCKAPQNAEQKKKWDEQRTLGQQIMIQNRLYADAKELKAECRHVLFEEYKIGDWLKMDSDFPFIKEVLSYHPQFFNKETLSKKKSCSTSAGRSGAAPEIKGTATSTSTSSQKVSRVHISLSAQHGHDDINRYTKIGVREHTLHKGQPCFFLAGDKDNPDGKPREVSYHRSVDNIPTVDAATRRFVEGLITRILWQRPEPEVADESFALLQQKFPNKWADPQAHRYYLSTIMQLALILPRLSLRLVRLALVEMVEIDTSINDLEDKMLACDEKIAKLEADLAKKLASAGAEDEVEVNNKLKESGKRNKGNEPDAAVVEEEKSKTRAKEKELDQLRAAASENVDTFAQGLDVSMQVVLEFLGRYFDCSAGVAGDEEMACSITTTSSQEMMSKNPPQQEPSPASTTAPSTPRTPAFQLDDGGDDGKNKQRDEQHGHGVASSNPGATSFSLSEPGNAQPMILPDSKRSLLQFILTVFEDLFLAKASKQGKHVQFIFFYLCSLHPKFCEEFLLRLLSTFYNSPRAVGEGAADGAPTSSTMILDLGCSQYRTRCAALNYLGSMLVRAKFLSLTYALKTTKYLIDWCLGKLSAVEEKMLGGKRGDASRVEDIDSCADFRSTDNQEVKMFHLAVQNICYIMIYKKDVFLKKVSAKTKTKMSANSTSNMPAEHTALSDISYFDDATYLDTLFFQCNFIAVLNSPIRPLRRLYYSVREHFQNYMLAVPGLGERLKPMFQWTFPNFPNQEAFDPFAGYELSTPTFPFDPYELRHSKCIIEPLYISFVDQTSTKTPEDEVEYGDEEEFWHDEQGGEHDQEHGDLELDQDAVPAGFEVQEDGEVDEEVNRNTPNCDGAAAAREFEEDAQRREVLQKQKAALAKRFSSVKSSKKRTTSDRKGGLCGFESGGGYLSDKQKRRRLNEGNEEGEGGDGQEGTASGVLVGETKLEERTKECEVEDDGSADDLYADDHEEMEESCGPTSNYEPQGTASILDRLTKTDSYQLASSPSGDEDDSEE
eukprot:g145.t1